MIDKDDIEVDESLITGEADAILKKAGDMLLSGSFVSSGSAYTKVVGVGKDTYAAKLADEARKFKLDRKSTRLNSSHANISYAVFCLKKKKIKNNNHYYVKIHDT